MAVFSATLHPSDEADLTGTINTVSSSSEISIGTNRIFCINSDKNLCIRFGNTSMAASSASFFRIPAGTIAQFDTGSQLGFIRLYNLDGATATYWIKYMSKV